MFIKETQNTKSLLDFLVQLMPDVNFTDIQHFGRPKVNGKAAKKLYSLWRDEKNALGKNLIRRPITCAIEDVKMMEREGLVKLKGENIEITSKGGEIIRTMILGDDKSAFDDNGEILEFHIALANTKPRRKIIRGAKQASFDDKSNWYKKL